MNALKITKPNFIYIGTSMAGSTWIFNLLCQHPDVFMLPSKGAYYYNNHFEKGTDWYLDHFEGAGQQTICGEVSHSYLVSPIACERIHAFDPNLKLMVCLRNPIDRAFSSYLDRVKNGRFEGTFEDALEEDKILVDRGRYATHLKHYLDTFGRENIHISHFDDIKNRPDAVVKELFEFLGVEPLSVKELDLRQRMPAGKPRSKFLTRSVKKMAFAAKKLGLRRLLGGAKKSIWLRNILYQPYTEQTKPQMSLQTREHLKNVFRDEVHQLDQMISTNFELEWLGEPSDGV